jgi:AraC family transcriptional regulator of adaptative response / DNA-3-methyladenine glycosylase II
MELDHESCYRIFQARDARFDGRVFAGVHTTGIYCRPICPARTPKSVNVTFFASAAAARGAGFRPCLRCRPEVAPELAAWNGTASTVTRALRLIDAGSLETPDIDLLAERLGIGARQLRRLFARHVGASPGTVLQTRRIHLANQLIQDTRIPMTQIAFASGFRSVRRFNETVRDLFGRPPTSLRRSRAHASVSERALGLTLRLGHARPYAWDQMLSFLAMRAIPGVEAVIGDTYARSVSIDDAVGDQGIIIVAPGRAGELTLRLHGTRSAALSLVISRVRGMFDLATDSCVIDAHLNADPLLAPLVAARPGLRVPGAWAGFELAVRAILGQQITVRAARALAATLVGAVGQPLDSTLSGLYPGVTHAFPTAASIAGADLTVLGMPRSRVDALRSLARIAHRSPDVLEPRGSLQESIQTLTSLDGIGDWTAQYIAMRALREPDAFPATDVALLRAIRSITGRHVSPAQLLERAERWRPWRAYGALHLWASLGTARHVRSIDDAHVA